LHDILLTLRTQIDRLESIRLTDLTFERQEFEQTRVKGYSLPVRQ
jgi:hypothetical protein